MRHTGNAKVVSHGHGLYSVRTKRGDQLVWGLFNVAVVAVASVLVFAASVLPVLTFNAHL